jgi:hypothetical protein
MGTLKQQMEEAFVNAHYDNNGNVIWNVNNISGRLDKDVANIEEALDKKAKPTLNQFKKDIDELFGDKVPEAVDSAFKDLANTIDSGKGTDAVMKSLKNLENVMTIEANKLGMNLMFGGVEGVYNGTPAFTSAITNGMVKPGIDTAKDGFKEKSPSKVFEQIGEYLPEGAAIGVEKGIPKLNLALRGMAESARAVFAGLTYNIPSLDFGGVNRTAYGNSNNAYADAATSLYEQMGSALRGQNGQTEVVFRIEGDPYGMFKIVREENDKYKRMHSNRSAFT